MTVKSVLNVMEDNYKTHLSLQQNNASSSSATSAGSNGVVVPNMKKLVEEVLTATGYSDQRAAKMDMNDFLCLLAAFNAKGIHFS
jgi:18S rRNA (adenine1779-N6/adenine1780-N6)-dimethyltransferase